MNFIVDMPLPPLLAAWLVKSGHEAVHASQVDLSQAPDAAIIEYARSEGRIVITADLDYPRLMHQSKAADPGIILLRGGDFGEQEARSRITRLLDTVREDRLHGAITVVERSRIRRHALPL